MLLEMDLNSCDLIFQGTHFNSYRTHIAELGGNVIIKKPRVNDWVSNISRLKNEFDIRKKLFIAGIPKVISYHDYDKNHVLISEDVGGNTLKNYIKETSKQTLESFLIVAIQIVEILENIHDYKLIHKNINPHNIIINQKKIFIVGFSHASDISKTEPVSLHPLSLDVALPYLSPEQTGRMNREVDYRSDYYSLGVCFYEMITGKLPFESTDPISLIHQHLTQKPQFIPSEYEKIPLVIINIILKLLEKNPDNRYQSSFGLLNDLKQCLEYFRSTGLVHYFAVGITDRRPVIKSPNRIFGRKEQLQYLKQELDSVSNGKSSLVCIQGNSGIGKSAFVEEFYRKYSHQNMYFSNVKCDQLKIKSPYFTVINIVKDLISQILSLSPHEIEKWKKNIENILGHYASQFVHVFPEILRVIDVEESFQEDKEIDLNLNFTQSIINIISLFTKNKKPLVIFVDDSQWLDKSSLNLLQVLVCKSEIKYCMLIMSYRTYQFDRSQLMTCAPGETCETLWHCILIELGPLTEAVTALILSSMLSISKEKVIPWAKQVCQKTTGNPFYIQQFIGMLYEKNYLYLNKRSGNWYWDLEAIEKLNIIGDVEDIILNKLYQLSAESLELLSVGSCIGYKFSLEDLVMATNKKAVNLIEIMSELINIGLVIPNHQHRELEYASNKIEYKFLHDKVQHICYQLLDKDFCSQIHLAIARGYLKRMTNVSKNDEIVFVVNQYNSSLGYLSDEIEKYLVARLNVIAGQNSKLTGSYEVSLQYYKNAIELLSLDHWITHYKFISQLYIDALETAYTCQNLEFVDSIENIIKKYIHDFLDRVPAVILKIKYLLSCGYMSEAKRIGVLALEKLGVEFNGCSDFSQIKALYVNIESKINALNLIELQSIPEIKNENENAIISILVTQIEIARISDEFYFSEVVLLAVDLCLKGHSPHSGFVFANYAFMLASLYHKIDEAMNFSELALYLQKKYNHHFYLPRVLNVVNAHLRHFRKPMHKLLPSFERSIELSFLCGDMVYAGQAITYSFFAQFIAGEKLPKILDFVKEQVSKLNALNQISYRNAVFPWCQIIQNLQIVDDFQLNSSHIKKLKGQYFNESLIFQHDHNQDQFIPFSAYLAKAYYHYLQRDFCLAMEAVEKSSQFCFVVHGMLHYHIYYFYAALIYLAMSKVDFESQGLYFAKAQVYFEKISFLKKYSHDNYFSKYLILQAEISTLTIVGNTLDISSSLLLFERAIEVSLNHGFLQEAAIASELAARFCLEHDLTSSCRGFLMTSIDCYKSWGSTLKIYMIAKEFSSVLMSQGQWSLYSNTINMHEIHSAMSLQSDINGYHFSKEDPIDYLSALKVSQLISQELDHQRLLIMIIELISVNAGAERGFLLLVENEDDLVPVAQFPNHQNLSQSSGCLTIINYVRRSRKPLVIDDALTDVQYYGEKYIIEHQVRSILCAPFMYQNRLMGVIYLENNQASHAFNTERLAFLQLVAKQSAISLENSRFYEAIVSAEEAMQDQKSLLESIINSISEAVLVIDENKEIIHFNYMAEKLLGISTQQIPIEQWPQHYGFYEMDKRNLVSSDSFPALRALNGEYFNDIAMHIKNDRHITGRDILVSGCPLTSINDKNRKGGVISIRDMSEFNRNLEQIQHLATHDELTGLPNRTLFYDRIEQAILQSKKHQYIGAVLFLDLDNFKEVNDSLGHSIGDKLLIEICHRLQAIVKNIDTVARLGGDEFGMLLDNLRTYDDVLQVAQRIINTIALPVHIEDQSLMTSVSVGITLFPSDGNQVEQLLKNADLAMYSAKSQGRNTYRFFAESMNNKIQLRKSLGKNLRDALNTNGFCMHYQPQIDTLTGKLLGFEALIRWPANPTALPETFMAVAEEIGLINAIGEWVLRTVCLQIQQWRLVSIQVPVAVNISALQFKQPHFITMVQRIMLETGVPASLLEFEITESAAIHFKEALTKMQQLNDMGIKIALDDFGTGYSSLSYLKRFPVYKVKIDKSFIQDIDKNEESKNIAHAIITLSHCLKMTVVAEGVETESQLTILSKMQCDIIQGHIFGKPLAVNAINSWIKSHEINIQSV